MNAAPLVAHCCRADRVRARARTRSAAGQQHRADLAPPARHAHRHRSPVRPLQAACRSARRPSDRPRSSTRSSPAGSTGRSSRTMPRRRVEGQAEAGAEQPDRRRRRPGLRRAGHGIGGRPLAAAGAGSRRTAPAAAAGPVAGRRRQPLEQPRRRGAVAVAGEAEADQRVVVRPDRAVVVAHRVVAGLGRRQRADAPAGEEAAIQHLPRDRGRPLGRGQPPSSTCPAFEARTRQGRFVPSSASA